MKVRGVGRGGRAEADGKVSEHPSPGPVPPGISAAV